MRAVKILVQKLCKPECKSYVNRIVTCTARLIIYARLKGISIAPRFTHKRMLRIYMGAVLIEGPKWCGKTRTSEEHAGCALY